MFLQAGHVPINTLYLTLKNEVSKMHKQISTPEASINRYEGEEKAKHLQKMKAERCCPGSSSRPGTSTGKRQGRAP